MPDLVHRLAYADRRGEVHHRVYVHQRAANVVRVSHVADDELDLRVEIRGPTLWMNLRKQAVQSSNLVAFAQKLV